LLSKLQELSRHDILRLTITNDNDNDITNASNPSNSNLHWDDKEARIGFPNPTTNSNAPSNANANANGKGLHGSTKTAAKRRLAALKRVLKKRQQHPNTSTTKSKCRSPPFTPVVSLEIAAELSTADTDTDRDIPAQSHQVNTEILTLTNINNYVCPKQASYAGSNPAQSSSYQQLAQSVLAQIPTPIVDALDIDHPSASRHNNNRRQLYTHQVAAIESALQNKHTLVCTGTGSGKSLGFLLPVLQAAYCRGEKYLHLFPIKALAQDQLVQLFRHHPALYQTNINDSTYRTTTLEVTLGYMRLFS
jgi:DEAD/DEAH box helicase domain-containing protein